MQKGKFIVIEGIDGSGITTQSEILKRMLLNKKIPSIVTAEPSNGLIGNLIKEILRNRISFFKNREMLNKHLAYLFASDRYDHLYNEIDGILTLNNQGITVISSRYFFSSLAYNSNNNDDFNFIKFLNKDFKIPDLTIYIDNPIELSLQRIKDRYYKDIYETKKKLEEVKINFNKVFEEFQINLLRIDGKLSITEIQNIIFSKTLKLFNN